MRLCSTCQHLKRPEIDRRLAGGEPLTHLANEYGLSQSSLYRHRTNCLKLASSNSIKKEAARGSAAIALLPTAETLSESYRQLGERTEQIIAQAEREGSLRIALSGLASLRQTLDSLMRLAAHEVATRESNPAPGPDQSTINCDALVERLIQEFDQEPETKARIAAALAQMDDEGRASAQRPDTDGTAAVAQGEAREQTPAGEPAALRLTGVGPVAAINASKADHAPASAATERCKPVHDEVSSPRPSAGSNTPSATAPAPADGKGSAGIALLNITASLPATSGEAALRGVRP